MCSRGEKEKDGNKGTSTTPRYSEQRRRKSGKPIGRLSDTAFSQQIYNEKACQWTDRENRLWRNDYRVSRMRELSKI